MVQLPSGLDPNTFIAKYGRERFIGIIEESLDLFDYKLKYLKSKFDARETQGKARIAEEILPTISKIKNAILKTDYLRKLADALAVDEASLRHELGKVRNEQNYNYRFTVQEKVQSALPGKTVRPAEKILTGLMIEDASLISLVKEKLTGDDFKSESIRKIVASLFEMHNENKNMGPSKLITFFGNSEMAEFISELVAGNESLVDKDKNLEDCVQWIKRDNRKIELDSMRNRIKIAQDSGDDSGIIELMSSYNRLMKSSVE